MAANDLEYGWYKWKNGFRQRDGFFVDRAGKVLYWPTRWGPGYVMDDAAIETVVQRYDSQEKMVNRGYFLVVILCVVLIVLWEDFLRRYFEFHILPIHVFVFVFILVREKIRNKLILPRWGLDLSHCPKIDRSSPAVRDSLVVAKVRLPGRFWAEIVGRSALAGLLIAIGVYYFDSTVARWFSGVATKTLLDQPLWWGVGLAGFLALVWRIPELVKARVAPIDADEIVARIFDTGQLGGPWFRREEDTEGVSRPYRMAVTGLEIKFSAIGIPIGVRPEGDTGGTSAE